MKVKQVEVERSCYSESKLHTPGSAGSLGWKNRPRKAKNKKNDGSECKLRVDHFRGKVVSDINKIVCVAMDRADI